MLRRAFVLTVLLALIVGLGFGVGQALAFYRIGGESMAPTLHDGESVIALRRTGAFPLHLERGMIVGIFAPYVSGGAPVLLAKRVVGLPGDQVEIRRDRPVAIRQGFVYVVGDNAENSYDSRAYGPIPIRNVFAINVVHGGRIETETIHKLLDWGWQQLPLPPIPTFQR